MGSWGPLLWLLITELITDVPCSNVTYSSGDQPDGGPEEKRELNAEIVSSCEKGSTKTPAPIGDQQTKNFDYTLGGENSTDCQPDPCRFRAQVYHVAGREIVKECSDWLFHEYLLT